MLRLGLYLHAPFCLHKCSYCDFNSWSETRVEPQRAWRDALIRQMRFWSGRFDKLEYEVDTIFFGGGTPSLIENDILRDVGRKVREFFPLAAAAEWTAECNPETLDEAKFGALADMGANRLSVGIQSFNDGFLEKLERHARAVDNHRALGLLSKFWRGRWSLDLMFGLPEQTIERWVTDLDAALAYGPKHISTYQLTLTTARSKSWRQAGEDALLEMTEHGEQTLAAAGLRKYETSNFARPGEESRHNLKYWRLEPFLGLGPGASGLLSGAFLPGGRFGAHQKQADSFEKWLAGAGLDAFEQQNLKARSAREHVEEALMMGLRLSDGLPTNRFHAIRPVFEASGIAQFIENKGERWVANERGSRVLDSVLIGLFKNLAEVSDAQLDSPQTDPKF